MVQHGEIKSLKTQATIIGSTSKTLMVFVTTPMTLIYTSPVWHNSKLAHSAGLILVWHSRILQYKKFSKSRFVLGARSPLAIFLGKSGNNRGIYQPGGTFMATTGKWATRSSGKVLVDPSGFGRWSGLSYLGKGKTRLSIVTADRSPRQQPAAGFGFYDQQYALLLSKGVKKPNV